MTPKLKTSLIAASLTLGVAAGAAYVALDYQGENGFHPFDSLRDLQNNQVLFPDSSAAARTPDGDGSRDQDNSYWERDDRQEETKPSGGADYLFQDDQPVPGQTTAAAVGLPGGEPTGGDPGSDTPAADVVYDFTDRGDSADTVLPSGGHDGLLPGGEGNGTVPGDAPGGDPSATPSAPAGDSGSSGGASLPGGDVGGGGGGGGAVTPEPAPAPAPAPVPVPDVTETVKDPEPTGGGGGTLPGFRSDSVSNNLDALKKLRESGQFSTGIMDDSSSLYQGQTIYDPEAFLLKALSIMVLDADNKITYRWGVNDSAYIRLAYFSMDEGKTLHTLSELDPADQLPIPADGSVKSVYFYFEYRLDEGDDWAPLMNGVRPYVACPVTDNRVYILDQKLAQDAQAIDPEHVLSLFASVSTPDYVTTGQTNLLYYQYYYLTNILEEDADALTHLFPGWMESGKLADWFYAPDAPGRHILQPADLVELDPAYTVSLNMVWMDCAYHIGTGAEHNNLSYLQTLTGWTGGHSLKSDPAEPVQTRQAEPQPAAIGEHDRSPVLSVPEGVQAVEISKNDPFSVDRLELPASVMYLNVDDNLRVDQSYAVDEDNPFLTAEGGLLFNKAMDRLMGIPYGTTEIAIPASVQKVELSEDNQLKTIRFEAQSYESLPELDLSVLSGATLTFADETLMAQFANDHTKELGNNRLAVDRDAEYTVDGGLMFQRETGTLYRVLAGKSTVVLPEFLSSVAPDAFRDSDAALLLLPEGRSVTFQPDSLRGSGLKAILCHTADQAAAVKAQLTQAGADRGPTVAVVQKQNGYTYYTHSDGETTLLTAPQNAVRFDAATLPDLHITAIADGAFEHCRQLRWAFLPQSAAYLGASCFEDCTALEGVLLDHRDTVTIGNNAFADCPALRFVASNAPRAVLAEGYDPELIQADDTDRVMTRYVSFFYVPYLAEGYGTHTASVDGEELLTIVEQNGNTLLCAVAPANELEPTGHTRVLRSGGVLNGALRLPENTSEIGQFALAFTKGSYTVNLDELSDLFILSGGAFYRSGLQGELHLAGLSWVMDYAFGACPGITSVTLDQTVYVGPDAFTDCAGLTTARFGNVSPWFSLSYGMFNRCNALTEITLDCVTPPSVEIRSPGIAFQFNYAWTPEEEAEALRVSLNEAADPIEFIRAWRYINAGYYTYDDSSTPYLELWYDKSSTLIADVSETDDPFGGWRFPTDQETDLLAKQAVLESENRLRAYFGLEQVSQPTDFFAYRMEYSGGTGYLTLTDACTDAEALTLDAATLEMPAGWCLDYLDSSAFCNSPNLTGATVNDPLVAIHEGAFCGLDRDFTLVLNDKDTVTALELNGSGPYDFGMAPSLLRVVVPEERKAQYFDAWLYPLAGYSDGIALYDAVWAELGESAGPDEILARAEEILAPYREQLAAILDYTPPARPDQESAGQIPEQGPAAPAQNGPGADAAPDTTPDEVRPQEPEDFRTSAPSEEPENGTQSGEPTGSEEHVPREEPEETISGPEAPAAPEETGEEPAQ